MIHRVRFCLRCGTRLRRLDDHGSPRPTCPSCRFVYYRNPVPAAGGILAEDGAVLLVKRRYAPRAGAWCLPSGFMEYGETPERCARRELREETGIVARLTGLFGVYAGLADPTARAVLILYTGRRTGGRLAPGDGAGAVLILAPGRRTGGRLAPGDDASDARMFPLDQLPEPLAFAAHDRALAE